MGNLFTLTMTLSQAVSYTHTYHVRQHTHTYTHTHTQTLERYLTHTYPHHSGIKKLSAPLTTLMPWQKKVSSVIS